MDQQHAQAEITAPTAIGTGGSRHAPMLMASSPLAIVVFDFEGKVHLWSAAAERLFGWSESDVLGRSPPFIPSGKEHEPATFIENATCGRICAAESQRLRRDGSLLELRITAAPIEGQGDVTQVLVMYEDISERKRAEQMQAGLRHVLELLATDASLETLLTELVLITERQSVSGMLGSVLLLDRAAGRLRLGAAPSLPAAYNAAIDGVSTGPEVGCCGAAAFTGQPAHAEDISTDPRWRDFRALAASHGLAACWSTPILSRDGEVLGTFAMYYRETRVPDALDLSLVDLVTDTAQLAIERHRSIGLRRRSAARMQALLDAAPMGVYLVDSDFRIAAVNRTAMPVFGDIPELIGRDFEEVTHILWPDAYADELVEHFRHTLETGEEFIVDERAEMRRDTGIVEYYEWRISRITLPGGQHGVVSYFKDISDSVRRREQFRQLSVESERQRRLYDAILSSLPDLVFVFDLQHRFTYANNALLGMWGKTWEESIGRTCLELGYEPWHAARHDREIEQVIATKRPVRGEVPFTGVHGRRIYDYIFVPILGPEGDVEAIAGTTRDVTDRELARTSLQHSEQLLSQIFDAAPTFMAVLRGEDMAFEKANDGYRELVGAGRALIGRTLPDALPEIVDTPFPRIVHDVLESGQPYHGRNVRVSLRRKDGGSLEERWVDFVYEPVRDADGVVSAVFVHGVDLTDRILAEQALRDSEQRLRFVIDSMPQKIFTATPAGVVDYFNPAWVEFAGLSTEELQDSSRFVHPDDLLDNRTIWRHSVATGEPFQFEQRFRRADGEYRWHISRAAAMKNEAGEVLMWIGSNTDIHEQRQAANELRSLASSLAESDRRKDEFLAVLAHELRNPLAPISNALQILRLSRGDAESANFATTVMERQLGQLVRLVDDLLDVSRISRGKIELRPQAMTLQSSVEQAVEAARPLVEQMEQVLTMRLPREPIWLEADPTRLAQVVGNLLTNASKFTDRHGRIDLAVERDGGDALVRVRDTGIGIAPEQVGRIFDMFTQLDTSAERSSSGLGIGLSLVKSLVEMHGGSVEVHSEGLGTGAEFVLRLPTRSTEAGGLDGGDRIAER